MMKSQKHIKKRVDTTKRLKQNAKNNCENRTNEKNTNKQL